MAPGAKIIHCKVFNSSASTSEALVLECLQWDLAPWDLNGLNPDPARAPDVVNLLWSWGGGGNNAFRTAILNLQAAGIVVVTEVGNGGSVGCGTVYSAGDYQEVISVGGVDQTAAYPGNLSSTSSRGPSSLDPGYHFPDVMAPSFNICSTEPGGGYYYWNGTTIAPPHVTGLVALMWSARPSLRGDVLATEALITAAAVPLTGQTGDSCGGDYTDGPNFDWGHGTIDALATIQSIDAFIFVDGFESGDTSQWDVVVGGP